MRDVVVERLSKRFGDYNALSDVSVRIEAGEFVSILGPSGCGKTTLLRIIAGLERPDAGRLVIGGHDVTGLPVWKRHIGLVFQNFALWPHLNVFRNVSMGLELQGIAATEIKTKVNDALDLVRLGPLAERFPSELSGGQQQRVAIARAIVLKPSVLLLDEPLSSLDKNLRQDMQVELKLLQRNLGLTTVFVTHDQEEALSLSDRVVVMNKGIVEQVDAPSVIYSQPTSRFVARFVGETTFFSGQADNSLNVKSLKTHDGLTIPIEGGICNASATTAFVRPEWVRISKIANESTTGAIHGRVKQVMYFGSTRDYLVQIAGAVVRVKAVGEEHEIAEGEEVLLNFAARLLPSDAST